MTLNIGFIGAGKAGTALGLYFSQRGLAISGYTSKTPASAQRAAQLTGSRAFHSLKSLAATSDVILITVPDLAIELIDARAADLISHNEIPRQKCWIHTSGALSSNALPDLKALGCAVGSLHPLLALGEPELSASQLSQAFFGIEGTAGALDIIRRIMSATGNPCSSISEKQKPLYHAGACMISNFFVTLLESGFRCFEAAGIDRSDCFAAIQPLLQSTLANIQTKGTINALTGPIVRGDHNTLQIQLQVMGERLLSECGFYKALAYKTIDMVAGKRIDKQQEFNLIRVLKET